ncbi:unnamed protein product, partial [marine sediment metagenome]
VTRGKYPASTVKNYAALRALWAARPLLPHAASGIVLTFEMLKIKAPHPQRQKGRYQKQQKKSGNSNASQFSLVTIKSL